MRRYAVAAIIGLALCPHPARSEPSYFPEIEEKISELARDAKYLEALALADELGRRTKAASGEESVPHALALSQKAALLHVQGQLAAAEPLFERVLALLQKHLPPDDPHIATAMNNLGMHRHWTGRYQEAERLLTAALEAREKVLKADDPAIAESLNNLAHVYKYLGRTADVILLLKRSLGIRERTLDPNDQRIGQSLQNLASAQEQNQDFADAEINLRRAEGIYAKVMDPTHPVAVGLQNRLAVNLFLQRRFKAAVPYFEEARRRLEASKEGNPLVLAATLTDFAINQVELSRLDEAESLLRRALAIREKLLPRSHSDLSRTLGNLADVMSRRRRFGDALDTIRKASRITLARDDYDDRIRLQFLRHVRMAWEVSVNRSSRSGTRLADEAFIHAQHATQTDTGATVARMAARFAANDANIRERLREADDLAREQSSLEEVLSHAFSIPSAERTTLYEETRIRLAEIEDRRSAIAEQARREFPKYFDLVKTTPLGTDDVASLLRQDEVLIAIVHVLDDTYVWAVTQTQRSWRRIGVSEEDISKRVRRLRCGLDRDGEWVWSSEKKRFFGKLADCAALRPDGLDQNEGPPFDPLTAYELYELLLGPIRSMTLGRALIIVSSGPLSQLPFHAFVTEKPIRISGANPADFERVKWIVTESSVTSLPSIASLKALRRNARSSDRARPFIGFGNPLLIGQGGNDLRAFSKQSCAIPSGKRDPTVASRAVDGEANLLTGGFGNVAALRHQPPLPETADELCSVGANVGAADGDINLGERATETRLKQLSANGELAQARILHFATHGLLAQETENFGAYLSEPALVLTPPDVATTTDDGLLTSAEVMELKLDADWVVLSACNTASAGENGEETTLSGLARAFFYAGARALLVSHWYVDSTAAVQIVTGAFSELALDPKVGRAEALRRSIVRAMRGDNRPKNWVPASHPSVWAPFVLVGESAN